MGSSIEWTDETWNPVTGCTRISPGCDHCYMFALYPRLRAMNVRGYEESPSVVREFPERLGAPLAWKTPRRVFVNSMADLFHPDISFPFVFEAFSVMREAADRHGHIFQALTKRPGRAVAWWEKYADRFPDGWPQNIWIGTSVENQKYAPRITVLARLPAPVKFVSAEPLLGPVDLRQWLENGDLQWVIVGGESGRGARPMDIAWARDLRDQARDSRVAFFFKQMGGARGKRSGAEAVIDGRQWRETPVGRSA